MAKRWRGLAPIGLLAFVSFAGCENDKATCPKDDSNPCTADLCEGGATVHKALPAGSICHDRKGHAVRGLDLYGRRLRAGLPSGRGTGLRG